MFVPMKNILYIISSPRGEDSFSTRLGNAVIDALVKAHPDLTLKIKDLYKTPIPHIVPGTEEAIQHSDQAIAEKNEADIIVIGAPLWNFGIPSVLKAWTDVIVRANITFKYINGGVEGLVNGKKVYVAMASGGIYSGGPMQTLDFVSTYLKGVLGFIGMTDVAVFRAEGLAYPGMAEAGLQKGIDSIVL